MKRILPFLAALTLSAHTLILVDGPRIAAANALATSETFGNNGDGQPAFIQLLYPGGDTNAPLADCWSWTAATFTPARRAALAQLAASAQWSNHVRVLDFDSAADPGFIQRVFATNNLAPAPANLFPQP